VKYAFIQAIGALGRSRLQCRVLEVSVTGYHEHFIRRARAAQRRHLSDDALLLHIKAIHAQTHGGYGWPRTWKELLARACGLARSGCRADATARHTGQGKRRFKVTTDSNHDLPIAPNLLNREFNVAAPTRLAGDITYIATDEGWLFLAVVIDCSAPGGGLVAAPGHASEIVIDALRMACSSATQADTPR